MFKTEVKIFTLNEYLYFVSTWSILAGLDIFNGQKPILINIPRQNNVKIQQIIYNLTDKLYGYG